MTHDKDFNKYYEYNINECIQLPECKWEMTIGNFTIQHTTEYSRWKAFWLRFMGWEVTKQ